MDNNDTTTRPGLFNRHAGHFAEGIEIAQPGRFTPGFVRLVRRVAYPLVRLLFRARLEGLENLPAGRPFLLVSNHSGGAGLAELASFYALYLKNMDPPRPLAGFALPLGFRLPPMSRVLRSGGCIPSTFEAAATALKQGVPVLIFPGGDHETLRPIHQANRVDFGGRNGFLRIAREMDVPVVPMGIRGSHLTAPVLVRWKPLAWFFLFPRLLGIKRWGISLLSVVGAALIWTLVPWSVPARLVLEWFWLGSPFIFLPWIPWSIRMRIGKPLEPEAILATPDDPDAARERVEAAVQALVDR